MTNDIQDRLEQLETRLAFQDDTIEQLHQEIATLGVHSARLQAQLSILMQRLKDMQPSEMGNPGDEPPPPHY